jgi:hypothetical protein
MIDQYIWPVTLLAALGLGVQALRILVGCHHIFKQIMKVDLYPEVSTEMKTGCVYVSECIHCGKIISKTVRP